MSVLGDFFETIGEGWDGFEGLGRRNASFVKGDLIWMNEEKLKSLLLKQKRQTHKVLIQSKLKKSDREIYAFLLH